MRRPRAHGGGTRQAGEPTHRRPADLAAPLCGLGAERFAELDKRLAETDKRVQLQIELAVRDALDKRNNKPFG